jgi:hypothetical protein
MLEYIKKFDEGGIINVEAMRKDIKNDPRFFDKKNGNFTRSGKERLAAIEEISSVQDKGLTYKINDNNTFDIVDKSGKAVNTVEGKGVETGKNISPFYGLLNKEKRSKKEVSTILGEKTNSEQKLNVETTDNKNKEISKPDKPKTSLLEDAKSVISKIKDNDSKKEPEGNKETANKTEPVSDKKVDKNSFMEKFKGQLPNEDSKPTDKNYLSTNVEVKDPVSELDNLINNALMEHTESKNPVLKRESEVLKAKLDHLKKLTNNNLVNKDSVIEEQNVVSNPKDDISIVNNITQGEMKSASPEELEKLASETVRDYKEYKKSLFNEKIKDLDAAMKSIESNVSFTPEVKAKHKEKIISAKSTLEKMKLDFINKDDASIKNDFMQKFGERVSIHKKGGSIIKFQNGGYFNAKGYWVDENGKVDFSKTNKDMDPFETMSANDSDLKDAGKRLVNGVWMTDEEIGAMQDNQMSNLTNKLNTAAQESNGSMQITNNKKSTPITQNPTDEDIAAEKAAKAKRQAKRQENLRKLSGKTIDLTALVPTFLKWKIARDAIKNPVSIVPRLKSIYKEHGSKNVLAQRDIDASSIQAIKNAIAGINTNYKGSDANLSVLTKKADQKEKMDKTFALIKERADYRRGDEDRADAQMEEKRLQGADDQQNIAKNINLNEEFKYKADIQNAENLAKRRSDQAAIDIAAVTEGAGILANKRVTDQQYKAGMSAEKIKADREVLQFDAKQKYDEYANLDYLKRTGQAVSDLELKNAKDAYISSMNAYKSYDSEGEITKAKTASDREGGFLDYLSTIFGA